MAALRNTQPTFEIVNFRLEQFAMWQDNLVAQEYKAAFTVLPKRGEMWQTPYGAVEVLDIQEGDPYEFAAEAVHAEITYYVAYVGGGCEWLVPQEMEYRI